VLIGTVEEPVVFVFTLQVLRNVALSLWLHTESQKTNVEHNFYVLTMRLDIIKVLFIHQ
jgi:hypothetical protein